MKYLIGITTKTVEGESLDMESYVYIKDNKYYDALTHVEVELDNTRELSGEELNLLKVDLEN